MIVTDGSPEPLGVTPTATGANIAVWSAHATAIEFCLFDDDREKRVQLPARSGDVFHGHIEGIGPGARYGLRAHGPWAPERGHRFNANKLLIDPYATALDRSFVLHEAMFANDADSAPVVPKAVIEHAADHPAPRPFISWSRTVIYELHVRGFTMRHPDIPPELRGRFAALAHPVAIAHLRALGVTTVEIMPAAAWIDEPHLQAVGLTNYWGYNPVALMAPDPRLAPDGWTEIRSAVAALSEAGIETIIDIVLNHTGEGDEHGPTLSLRGIDNAGYYRLLADDPSRYANDSGTGNCLALQRPQTLRLAMDTMRCWALRAGVHGFRFDLATALGRNDDGFSSAAPLLAAIAQDPILRGLKMIAEPWDIGPGGYQLGNFPAGWGEWNDRFRDTARRFWRGDGGMLPALATRLAGSADIFGRKSGPSRGINFITAHDGFTLADLVSHAHKHNEANGEQNRDGTDSNSSWNHVVEGPTADPAVHAARLADQRALIATVLLARGTPMLAMGTEMGHSQGGNNNAYAQDNSASWLNWAGADDGLLAWTCQLTALRHRHPALHADSFLKGDAGSLPTDVIWLRPDGAQISEVDWNGGLANALTMVLHRVAPAHDRVALLFNRSADPVVAALPPATTGYAWHVRADSSLQALRGAAAVDYTLAPRAVAVLVEEPAARSAEKSDETALNALADAAGIAADWWETDGTRHSVAADTKRALLAAMDLPAGSEAAIRDALDHLVKRRMRPLPHALTGFVGEVISLPLLLPPGLMRRPLALTLTLEDGTTRHLRFSAADGNLAPVTLPDRQAAQRWDLTLPDLPQGRHVLRRDDARDQPCRLTVAPPRCYRPGSLARDQKCFGIAAQLYAVRRDGDQGMGDFSTLAALAAAAAAESAAYVAVNPLHALFPTKPDRASPYYPSDRRFLEWLYLDLAALDDGLGPELSTEAWAVFSGADAVRYPEVRALKQTVLEPRFARFLKRLRDHPDTDHARAFAAFRDAGGLALARFAQFSAVAENASDTDARATFHVYLQFLADRQLATVATRGAGLIRDLAIGAAPDGAEAWSLGKNLARGVAVGAPPDPFSPDGQVWGLPPLNPLRLAEDPGLFAELVAANMRHAAGLRIDHVMGLTRLFWVPEGGRGADGAYVAYPMRQLLGELSLESHRARCFVIGEDLGTVPEGFRESLAAADILSTRVLLLERDGAHFRPPQAYPRNAAASVSTHDLPTLAGWRQGADIAERVTLGQIADAGTETAEREVDRVALANALIEAGIAPDDPAAEHRFVAHTPSALMLVQADDLDGATVAVNLPGTDAERPNWRRKLATPVPALLHTPGAQAILNALRAERPVTPETDPVDRPAPPSR